jgi:hypothetical protein
MLKSLSKIFLCYILLYISSVHTMQTDFIRFRFVKIQFLHLAIPELWDSETNKNNLQPKAV